MQLSECKRVRRNHRNSARNGSNRSETSRFLHRSLFLWNSSALSLSQLDRFLMLPLNSAASGWIVCNSCMWLKEQKKSEKKKRNHKYFMVAQMSKMTIDTISTRAFLLRRRTKHTIYSDVDTCTHHKITQRTG